MEVCSECSLMRKSEGLEERELERVFTERLEEPEQPSARVRSEHREPDDLHISKTRPLAHRVSLQQTRRVRTRRHEQTGRRARHVETGCCWRTSVSRAALCIGHGFGRWRSASSSSITIRPLDGRRELQSERRAVRRNASCECRCECRAVRRRGGRRRADRREARRARRVQRIGDAACEQIGRPKERGALRQKRQEGLCDADARLRVRFSERSHKTREQFENLELSLQAFNANRFECSTYTGVYTVQYIRTYSTMQILWQCM